MKVYDSAKKIVERLKDAGYTAYFAGGWVRDYLMEHPSADIDIATNADPETILKLFKHTIPVGINFGVVIVVWEGHHFEVSTFRQDIDYQDGRRPKQISLSNPEEDAKRRDFTINGMFYDPINEKIIDFVKGKDDLAKKVIRTIGDPDERFREDRLRMLRAIRFAYRFGFTVDETTRSAIKKNSHTLFPAVAAERVWQELNKMAEHPGFDLALIEMWRLGLLAEIFPELAKISEGEVKRRVSAFNHFPKKCPTILMIMELFPDHSLHKMIEVCERLKVSNKDQKIVSLTSHFRECVHRSEGCEDVVWAKMLSHSYADVATHVVAARMSESERAEFLKRCEQRRAKLKIHIDRIKDQKPLITSEDLRREGIHPGKPMGVLLNEAERLAVNEDINDKGVLIRILKETKHWPKHEGSK